MRPFCAITLGGRDAGAFAQLVRRYAGLVYGVCLRVTGDAHDAEDVAQECFMELARHAGSVASPLPAWLHVTAVNRSRNALRNAARRKRHEEQAMSAKDANCEPRWADVAPWVDQALAELPEGLRVPLLLHYLNGLTQDQVAAELGIDQSTVSRRIEKGIEELRTTLRKAGVVASTAVLGALLAENAASAAPATLTTGLAKMAMAGVGSGAASSAAAGALASVWAKVAVAVAAGLAITGAAVVYRRATRVNPHVRVDISEQVKAPIVWDDGRRNRPEEIAMPKAPAEASHVRREGGRVWIEGVPHGEGNSNSYARGLAIVLNHAGTPADYDTIMGDTGLAFIHAIVLGKDAIQAGVPVLFPEWQAIRGRFTGQKAFALWAEALRDTAHLGQARWHANMVLHLGINRRSAVAYLRAMAARHPEGVAAHLSAAADRYGQVLAELAAADTGGAAMTSREGREKLAKLAEGIAAIEAEAIAELEKAVAAEGAPAPPQPGKEAKILDGLKKRPHSGATRTPRDPWARNPI